MNVNYKEIKVAKWIEIAVEYLWDVGYRFDVIKYDERITETILYTQGCRNMVFTLKNECNQRIDVYGDNGRRICYIPIK